MLTRNEEGGDAMMLPLDMLLNVLSSDCKFSTSDTINGNLRRALRVRVTSAMFAPFWFMWLIHALKDPNSLQIAGKPDKPIKIYFSSALCVLIRTPDGC